jgi:energy-coupling factor transporter transmembrane protein EcfT
MFFSIPEDGAKWMVLGLPLSSIAILNGAQMTLRAIVILLAADGLSSSVNITEIAGLLERSGLQGLGFSIGVATNLLPDLRQSSTNAWHSLRMRGGLRANWWRGIQLLLLTVLSNSLRHAEEIVLAAEVRAFRPELSRKVSLRIGTLDWWFVTGEVSLLVVILVL